MPSASAVETRTDSRSSTKLSTNAGTASGLPISPNAFAALLSRRCPIELIIPTRTSPLVLPTASRSAPSAGPDGIRLFWFPPTDPDLAGYRVYRHTDEGGEPVRLAELPADLPFHLDRDVTPGVRYTYTVTAVDDALPPNESPHSESAADRMPASGLGDAHGPEAGG